MVYNFVIEFSVRLFKLYNLDIVIAHFIERPIDFESPKGERLEIEKFERPDMN